MRANYFESLVTLFELKKLTMLSDLIVQVSRQDLQQVGIEQKEIDRFMSLIDAYKRHRMVLTKEKKKCLVLRFLTGSKKVI